MIYEFIIFLGVGAAILLILQYLFGIHVVIETKQTIRRREELRKTHLREIYRQEQKILQEIIKEETSGIRKEFQLISRKINDYTEDKLSETLAEEVNSHKQSAKLARDKAVEAIEESVKIFDTQQQEISKQVEKEVEKIKPTLVDNLNDNFVDIMRVYVKDILRDEVNIDDQLSTILSALEDDKQSIIRDLKDGAS